VSGHAEDLVIITFGGHHQSKSPILLYYTTFQPLFNWGESLL